MAAAESAAKPTVIVGHSKILFWWPVWVFGYFMAFRTYFFEDLSNGVNQNIVTTHNELSLVFILILLFVITFTNMKLPPTLSLIFILVSAIIIILIKTGSSVKILPFIFHSAKVSMNFWFYFTVSTGLLLLWLVSAYIYDRNTIWIVKRGQVVIRYIYSQADDEIINATNATFVRKFDDFVCHWILGFGLVGDLYMNIGGRKEILQNVIGVRWKSSGIEKVFR
jgi:hypothetical protein